MGKVAYLVIERQKAATGERFRAVAKICKRSAGGSEKQLYRLCGEWEHSIEAAREREERFKSELGLRERKEAATTA